MSAYQKKGFTYYSTQYRSSQKVSINESLIFEQIENIIKEFDFSNENIQLINKNMLSNLIQNEENKYWNELINILKQIKSLTTKQEKLLDMQLNEVIDERTYIQKYNQLENEIKDCLEQKSDLEKNNFSEKTQIMFELLKNLYISYSKSSKEWKTYIAKKLMFELSIDNKKRLQIAESHLFKSLKYLNTAFGGAKGFDVWTFKENLSMINLEDLRDLYRFVKNWNL